MNLAAGKTKAPFYALNRLVARRLRMCDGCSEIFKLAGLPQLMRCEWTFLTVLL